MRVRIFAQLIRRTPVDLCRVTAGDLDAIQDQRHVTTLRLGLNSSREEKSLDCEPIPGHFSQYLSRSRVVECPTH